MTPCPLCVLGFPEPHTKEDWKRFSEDKDLHDKFDKIMKERGNPGARI